MDLGVTLTGVIIVLLCIIPFVVMSQNSKRKKQKKLQNLFDFAAKNQGNITQHDFWHKSSIGLDETNNTLFFIRTLQDKEITQVVKLEDMQKCQLINTNRIINDQDSQVKVIDKLELSFTPRDKQQAAIVLEFFKVESDSLTLTGELQLAEKWTNLANAQINALVHN
ncbi:hypothetical protein [Haliscomenobacter hydrossis]|uniref:Uncharacterized protein n=1 Tax=Haliscomenobacter hydrossis (strain ATCC 27775 / DSM 1100 / LMG 10767 / O) TaxID=760192 RepID=F4L7D2_HALH1|nr:hypothetical protein [Haliscomenobacter hydrossis]AEE53159.1 hypothetical protein Halhy_5334 [Haliscomenobacter hydrossis DSM 1100]